ncbi:hypothetical protein H310_03724 [Aphanomyces invadans]|uniref:Uncharacterized protein n=1 Tax=Aphanomyces invadans TaxID=157072 RepID=A0A024UIK9_9STRA|nr:hypothetical protein H310_03724 [Aphanomyces invadans]ETW06139.1 hypothetical protein H310_03724 [Aphanomyces invadans]|eukprot:XP_008865916.1 hypothetical protein H310_03724 [Aphanomyces invadans]
MVAKRVVVVVSGCAFRVKVDFVGRVRRRVLGSVAKHGRRVVDDGFHGRLAFEWPGRLDFQADVDALDERIPVGKRQRLFKVARFGRVADALLAARLQRIVEFARVLGEPFLERDADRACPLARLVLRGAAVRRNRAHDEVGPLVVRERLRHARCPLGLHDVLGQVVARHVPQRAERFAFERRRGRCRRNPGLLEVHCVAPVVTARVVGGAGAVVDDFLGAGFVRLDGGGAENATGWGRGGALSRVPFGPKQVVHDKAGGAVDGRPRVKVKCFHVHEVRAAALGDGVVQYRRPRRFKRFVVDGVDGLFIRRVRAARVVFDVDFDARLLPQRTRPCRVEIVVVAASRVRVVQAVFVGENVWKTHVARFLERACARVQRVRQRRRPCGRDIVLESGRIIIRGPLAQGVVFWAPLLAEPDADIGRREQHRRLFLWVELCYPLDAGLSDA